MHYRWHLVCALLLGAAPAMAQETDSKADSIAMRIIEASGGQAAWDAVTFLRFDFKLYNDRKLVYTIQHLWDKKLGIYRIEMPGPNNEPYVAVFYTDTLDAKVYWKGSELIKKDAATLMERFRIRYFHDLFFITAPFLLFDPGVTRKYLPDSTSEAEDVIQVTIPHWEGLPSTSFYFYSDRKSGRLVRTSYPLPSGEIRSYLWLDYEEYAAVDGSILLSTRKRAEGHPFLIETGRIVLPSLVGSNLFMSPTPILQPLSPGEEPADPQGNG